MLESTLESCLWNCTPDTAEIVKPFLHYFFSPYVFKVKEPCTHANILNKPDPRTFWTNDDSGITGKMLSGPSMARKFSVVKCCTKTRLKGIFGFACLYLVHHLNILHSFFF